MGSPSLENTSLYSPSNLLRAAFWLWSRVPGTSGKCPALGGFVSCTVYNWPMSHLGFSIMSFSDRLSSWMANLEPCPRAGTPKSPSGRFAPGSNRVKPGRVLLTRNTLDFPAGILIFSSSINEVQYSWAGLAVCFLQSTLIPNWLRTSIPSMTSTSVSVVNTISWHWPSTLSHCKDKGCDSPFTSTGTYPTPTTMVLDCFKEPRLDFHFWYHPHLQQDVVAPVSTRAATLTPAMVTLATINWDALSDTGATNVPIWPLIRFPTSWVE